MSGALAAQWFRVAPLRPQLRAHAQVHRHVARGQVWYVLQDHQSGRFFRISPAANLMLCLMNGQRSMQVILVQVGDRLGSDRPTQEEAVRLMVQLHQSDLLQTDLPPDMAELARRADRFEARRWRGWFTSPMAMRFPLADPDRFLTATMPLLRPLFTRAGFVAWLALLLWGAVLALLNSAEIGANVSDRVFTTYNVLMLVLLYPASKALHELGHGFMVKAHGGAVHETGIMLLVLLPVPYVDASSASSFPDSWRRVLVGAAGIMTELALASFAMIAWVNLQPGLLRAAAFNLVLLCSVSTLLFNGNPLLRFDGYYVLGDILGIHNLDQRSRRYLLYLVRRFGFGDHRAEDPVRAPGEAKWLAGYGALSFIYRIAVMIGVVMLVSQRYFAIGVILAMLSIAQMMLLPLLRGLRFLFADPALQLVRRRALTVTGTTVLVLALTMLFVPLPYALVADGVVWVPDEAVLRAGADGFVAEILASPDSEVVSGQKLIVLRDPVAHSQVEVLRAQVGVAESRFDAVNLIDMTQARLTGEQLTNARAALQHGEARATDLIVTAQRPGRLIVPEAARLPGQFVHKGDVLGYLIGGEEVAVRAVVSQADIDLVRHRTREVSLRYTETIDRTVPARVVGEQPAALESPPTAGLSPEGGGPMLLDPTSRNHDRPLDRWYEVIVRPSAGASLERIGGHAFVRFDLGAEPVAGRLLRWTHQTMLRLFDV